jgi:hypothetical protein
MALSSCPHWQLLLIEYQANGPCLPFERLAGAQTEDIYLKKCNSKLAVNSCGLGSKGVLLFEHDRQFEKGEYGVIFKVLRI